MNLAALLGIIPIVTKGAFLLKSPELIKKIFELVIAGVVFAESYHQNLPGVDQKNRAIAFIGKLYDIIDIEFVLPDSTDKFVKEELIPNLIDLVVYFLKSFKLIPKQIDLEAIKTKLN